MNKIVTICAVLLIFLLGLYSKDIYNNMGLEYSRQLNGLYLYNQENISAAMEYAYDRESDGDWICINVAYDMKPELAYKTCVHECSHKAFSEIYAESCEDSPTKCLGFLNEE